MYKYVALIGCMGIVLLLLLPGLRSFDADSGRSDPNPPRSTDDAKDRQSAPGITRLSGQQRKQIQRNAMTATDEDELVDGTVAREWGTFIEAKDIRTNCRDVLRVIRSGSPLPEDYERVCDFETVFDHPYALFSDEQLRQIAGYDAEAAYLLSYRMLMQTKRGKPAAQRDKETLGEALSYAMRSVILTGEKQAFDLLIDGRKFPNWGSVWSTTDSVPEDFQVAQKAEQYKWLKTGRNLGLIEEDDLRWILVSRQVERYKEYFDLEELDAQAAQQSDGISTQRAIASGTRN